MARPAEVTRQWKPTPAEQILEEIEDARDVYTPKLEFGPAPLPHDARLRPATVGRRVTGRQEVVSPPRAADGPRVHPRSSLKAYPTHTCTTAGRRRNTTVERIRIEAAAESTRSSACRG
jgi:hypothetical protein